jgi:hypothetical protein
VERRRAKPPTAASNSRAREVEAKAFELRKAGCSYREIGSKLSMSKQGAHKAVTRVLKELRTMTESNVNAVRTMEIERLDAMLRGLWNRAKKGEATAVDRVILIMRRRATLLGLDAPKESNVNLATEGGVKIYLPDNGRGPASN